jgi:hypothetical protein
LITKRRSKERVFHDMQDVDKDLVYADNADALDSRIKGGIGINSVDGGGWTLLHYAAGKGSVKCLNV